MYIFSQIHGRFANVPTDVRSAWNNFTKGYFLRSDSLVSVLLLIDASIPPQQIDLDCADWLGRNKVLVMSWQNEITIAFWFLNKKSILNHFKNYCSDPFGALNTESYHLNIPKTRSSSSIFLSRLKKYTTLLVLFLYWQIPLTIVFTKCDKTKKKTALEENVREFLRLLKKSYDQMPAWIMTSCITNQGRNELLMHIQQLKKYWSS